MSLIRIENLSMTAQQWQVLCPYLILLGGTCLALILSVFKSPKYPVFVVAILTCALAMWKSADGDHAVLLFNNMMVVDGYSRFFQILLLASALFTILGSLRYLDRENLQLPEYNLLVLFGVAGMMLMVSAKDLVVLFVALELMSIVIYCLVGFRRADRRSNEAAIKYFILGSAASAILLYGVALLYGATGTTQLDGILTTIQAQSAHPGGITPLFVLGIWFVVSGFLFKGASVPFHMWMPDVYEGAPTPITGFMTTGVKAAAFATFVRVLVSLGYGRGLEEGLEHHLHNVIWISALVTMAVGNVIALTQTSLKRMLAYSSIAHTGYLLVGLLAGVSGEYGYAPMVMYLVGYVVMNLGAFTVLSMLADKNDNGLTLHGVSGLSKRSPWLAFALAVFLFSMAGLPPTVGFAAKYLLFYSAIQAGEIWIVVLGVLCSAISVYFYLRVIVFMYMREGAELARPVRASLWAAAVVTTMVVCTLQMGIQPAKLIEIARHAMAGV